MSAPHLQHLATLIANDGHASSFQSLGQYRTALLKEIAQASAATEQEPVAYLCNGGTRLMFAKDKQEAIWNAGRPLYTHADPSDVTQLRADLETLERKGAGFSVLELFRNGLRDQLKAATQRADAAERKQAEAVGLLHEVHDAWCALEGHDALFSAMENVDTLLSASAGPAKCQRCEGNGYLGEDPVECPSCDGKGTQPAKGGDGELDHG